MEYLFLLVLPFALPSIIKYCLILLILKMAKENFCYAGISQNNVGVWLIGNKRIFLGNIPGRYIKRSGISLDINNLDEEAEKEISEKSMLENYLEKNYGIFWIGWPGQYKKENIPFQWGDFPKKEKTNPNDTDTQKKSGEDLALWERKEDVPFVRAKETYRMVYDELETKEGNIKMKIGENIVTETTDFYKAYFAPGNWFINVKGRRLSALIPYVASMTPEELPKADKETDKSEYIKIMNHQNNDIGHESVEEVSGVKVTEYTWTGQDLDEKSKAVQEASQLEFVNKRKNDAILKDAQTAADAKEIIANGNAKAIEVEGLAKIEILKKRGEVESEVLRQKGDVFKGNNNLTKTEVAKNLGKVTGALGSSVITTLLGKKK